MSDSANNAVFLSYASQDAEAAKRICEALRAAGVEVWFDQNELVGGDAWDQKIRKQIKDCALLIPIISAATQARREGYFRLEWRLADQRTHLMAKGLPFLLPVVIDATRDADAHVPDSFTEVQWTRLPDGNASEAFATRVKKLLSGEQGAGSKEPESVGRNRLIPPSTRERGDDRGGISDPALQKNPKRWLLPAIIGAAAVIGFAVWQLWRSAGKPLSPLSPVAGVSASHVAAAPLTEAQKLVQQARKIYEGGDELDRETLILADELVKRALALDGAEPTALLLGAQLSYAMVWQSFDSSEARKSDLQRQAMRARTLAPESVPAQLALANARIAVAYSNFQSASNRQDLASVEQDLLALAAQAPGDYKVQRALGQTYRFLKRPDEALRALQRAHELSGGDPAAAGDIINVLLRRKRYAEAEAMVAPALARRPIGRMLVLDVLLKLQWRGDLPGAQAALAAWPGWLLREDRGAFIAWQTWLWSRRPDMALDVAQRLPRDYLRDVWFTGPRAVLTARAHELAGNRESAQADWRTVVRLTDQELAGSEDEIAALFWKAWALSRLGDQTGAEAAATLLQQRMTLQTVFFNNTNLALLWSTLGRTDLAAAHLRAGFAADNDAYAVTRAMLELDPAYAPLRASPQFAELAAAAIAPALAKAQTLNPGSADQPAVDQKSVAVLAFANLSDDKANEYFSDGISEELLNVLAKVPGLKVTARTSSFHFKGKDTPIPEIAQQLGVAYVVEGSVRKSGDKVRVTAQLIKAADGFHVWSDTFTRDLKDVFAVQDEIAGLIARNLELKLGDTPASAREVNPEAHQLYLQGKYFLNQFSNESATKAAGLLQRAVELDPLFALAWVALSRAASIQGGYAETREEFEAGYRLAREAANRALELDPNLAAAYLAKADVQTGNDFDWKGAIESMRRAEGLAPADPAVIDGLARLAYYLGQREKSVQLSRRAVELDPVNPAVRVYRGFALVSLRRYSEGEAEFRRIAELNPVAPWGHAGASFSLSLQGRFDEAAAAASQEAATWSRRFALAIAQWGQKKTAEADATLAQLIKSDADVAAYQIAEVYSFRRDPDQAFAWLERAYRQRDSGLAWTKSDPAFEPLYGDPRWDGFLHKLGLADDQLK